MSIRSRSTEDRKQINGIPAYESLMTVHIEIAGVVQGVGFRPFLHRLAKKYHVSGWARNTSAGIEGCIAASPEELEGFLSELQNSPPPMAQIDAVRTEPCAKERTKDAGAPVASSAIDTAGAGHFVIRESRIKPGMTLIPPDTAMCPECEAELYTPTDRRYRYPFINCTNCGPRYTIIESLPYDRERTVMEEFPMCPDCEREYRDITDRRYHAQPDCCPDCGPKVFYFESRSEKSGTAEGDDAFRDAQRLLAAGGILAVKGIGGVHLSCSALDSSAVRRLRERNAARKNRWHSCAVLWTASGKSAKSRRRKNIFSQAPRAPSCCSQKRSPPPSGISALAGASE